VSEDWERCHKELGERCRILIILNQFEEFINVHFRVLKITCSIVLSSTYIESLLMKLTIKL